MALLEPPYIVCVGTGGDRRKRRTRAGDQALDLIRGFSTHRSAWGSYRRDARIVRRTRCAGDLLILIPGGLLALDRVGGPDD